MAAEALDKQLSDIIAQSRKNPYPVVGANNLTGHKRINGPEISLRLNQDRWRVRQVQSPHKIDEYRHALVTKSSKSSTPSITFGFFIVRQFTHVMPFPESANGKLRK